jgi:three-Cys-motif partner protein
MAEDVNPEYWEECSNLQLQKHALIRCYLGGWYPKLGSWAGRVLYADTHAGRGKHSSGELGSPLVALDTLVSHSHRERLLERCEFFFLFIEADQKNVESLKEEIKTRTPLPKRVILQVITGDCFGALKSLLETIRERKSQLAPAFIFVDPYGFKVPGSLLRELMAAGRVELFVNVIWRELDMAIAQAKAGVQRAAAGLATTLDQVFDGPEWRSRIDSADFDVRSDQAVDLLREKVGATWSTSIRMLGDNGNTRYLLAHFTNSDDGRDLMKDCVWKVCPDGGYYVRKWDDVSQGTLIKPQPDLEPVRSWVLARLHQGPKRWDTLESDLRSEIWRTTHLNQVIRALRQEGLIVAEDYPGRFGRPANPMLRLP